MAGPGRPKSEHPRDMVVSLRLTQAEYRALQNAAMLARKTPGELARALVLAGLREPPASARRPAAHVDLPEVPE